MARTNKKRFSKRRTVRRKTLKNIIGVMSKKGGMEPDDDGDVKCETKEAFFSKIYNALKFILGKQLEEFMVAYSTLKDSRIYAYKKFIKDREDNNRDPVTNAVDMDRMV